MSQFMWVNVHSLNGRRMIRSPCRSHHDGSCAARTMLGSTVLVMSVPAVVGFVLGGTRCGCVPLELLAQREAARLTRGLEIAVHDREHRHADQVVPAVVVADDA